MTSARLPVQLLVPSRCPLAVRSATSASILIAAPMPSTTTWRSRRAHHHRACQSAIPLRRVQRLQSPSSRRQQQLQWLRRLRWQRWPNYRHRGRRRAGLSRRHAPASVWIPFDFLTPNTPKQNRESVRGSPFFVFIGDLYCDRVANGSGGANSTRLASWPEPDPVSGLMRNS
jgi:hypothetical protein